MKKTIIFLIPFIFIFSCVTPTYLTAPKDFKTHVKGLYFEYKSKDGKILGEIIAVTPDAIILMMQDQNSKLVRIPANKIKKADVIISGTSDNPEKLLNLAGINCLSSAGHGFWGFFTLPFNLAVGGGTAQDAYSGSYRMKYPDDVQWNQLSKFARFPQGIPPEFKFNSLKFIQE